MKNVLIINIPMSIKGKLSYKSTDSIIKASEREVLYPVSAYLDENPIDYEDTKVILLIKKDIKEEYKRNVEIAKEELKPFVNLNNIIELVTDFTESADSQADLLKRIVKEIDYGANVLVDTTYGPKDLTLVLFTALSFAEKSLMAEIQNIIYGHVDFVDKKPTNAKLSEYTSLFYILRSVNTLSCDSENKARAMLDILVKR